MSGYPVGSKTFDHYLSPGVGYGVVVGVGAFFALLMVGLTRLQKRYTRLDPDTAGEFLTASHSVKPGLICCVRRLGSVMKNIDDQGIVSAWTWSATLLQSSAATYSDGLSAAWWYGVGGTIQIVFFAAVAAKVKQNANGAVTFPQIGKARYGSPTFLLFTFYALLCAHTVSGALVLGASATINALTGANVIACNFLLPLGIAVYVVAGGLRATFHVDFLHTAIMFVVIYIFIFTIYGTSDHVGSPGKLWDLLQQAAELSPVPGNTRGSYTTLKSNGGILFAASFATVFCDQGYWQRAIASRPDTTTRAYMLGGVSWFAIPWAFGTVMGLSCRALMTNPNFPTYPYALTASQASAGLVAPAAAVTVLGTGGAIAVLLVVFMAATSATSAELISVASIVTFDVLGFFWKPLRGRQAVGVTHIVIIVFAIWIGAWSTILDRVNINLGWLYYVQGVLLVPAVTPVALTVIWRKQSAAAAFFGTLLGTVCGLIGWFVGCLKVYGSINITNLALPYSAISGEAPGFVVSTVATIAISLLNPSDFDWETTRSISIEQDVPSDTVPPVSADLNLNETQLEGRSSKELESQVEQPAVGTTGPLGAVDMNDQITINDETQRATLQHVFVRSIWFSVALTLVVGILIPIPMFASHYVFSRRFFEVWIGFSIVWSLAAGTFCILLPIWESRFEMLAIYRSVRRAAKGYGDGKRSGGQGVN